MFAMDAEHGCRHGCPHACSSAPPSTPVGPLSPWSPRLHLHVLHFQNRARSEDPAESSTRLPPPLVAVGAPVIPASPGWLPLTQTTTTSPTVPSAASPVAVCPLRRARRRVWSCRRQAAGG